MRAKRIVNAALAGLLALNVSVPVNAAPEEEKPTPISWEQEVEDFRSYQSDFDQTYGAILTIPEGLEEVVVRFQVDEAFKVTEMERGAISGYYGNYEISFTPKEGDAKIVKFEKPSEGEYGAEDIYANATLSNLPNEVKEITIRFYDKLKNTLTINKTKLTGQIQPEKAETDVKMTAKVTGKKMPEAPKEDEEPKEEEQTPETYEESAEIITKRIEDYQISRISVQLTNKIRL